MASIDLTEDWKEQPYSKDGKGQRSTGGNSSPCTDSTSSRTSRAWCFTINNYKCPEVKFHASMNYLLHSLQIAPTTGTPHIQGYVQWKKARDMTACIKGLNRGRYKDYPSVQVAMGTWKQNHEYIMKGETNIQPGVEEGIAEDINVRARKQGARTDLMEMKQAIMNGKSRMMVIDEFPELAQRYRTPMDNWFRMKRDGTPEEIEWPVVTKWFTMEKPDPANKKRHIYLWGPPTIGKTHQLQTMLEGKKVFMAGSEFLYRFEDYDDEDIVIYDDTLPIRKELIDATETWKLSRRRVGKNRYSTAYWKKGHTRNLIILANHPPSKTLNDAAFQARFTVIEVKE